MKKVFTMLLLMAAGTLCVQAQIQTQVQSPTSGSTSAQEFRRLHLGFDLGSNIVGGESFFHFDFELGYYLNQKNMLTLELGGGSLTGEQIGTFGYTVGATEYTDGKIYYGYRTFNPTLSWSYFLNAPEKKWRWYVGPSIGLLKITGDLNYKWGQSVTIDNLPKIDPVSSSAGVLSAHVGLNWNFARRWFANLEYRIGAHTGITLDSHQFTLGRHTVTVSETSFDALTHKITVGVGWRFGSIY
ncbi:MAG: porin family protein [Prevotellaceae bacterium]|jgi:opacity protein-like surface antigen|nr:porin family protein [Prevotellaceae bacterium]